MSAQQKTFSADLKKFVGLAVPGLVVACVLGWFGLRQYNLPRTEGFPPDDWFIYGPWGLAALILLMMALIFASNFGKKVVVTPKYVEFHRLNRLVFRCLWTNLSFTPPRQDKKRFLTAIISDGSHYERLEDFFFPDFELMVEIIREAKRHARDEISTT